MFKELILFSLFGVMFFGCVPKGPQTYNSLYIGKHVNILVASKGKPTKIKNFGDGRAYIYVKREEYYGKNVSITPDMLPKKVTSIEYIYYINSKDEIYKYQVWKKKAGKNIDNK